jgi:hypothetical protein
MQNVKWPIPALAAAVLLTVWHIRPADGQSRPAAVPLRIAVNMTTIESAPVVLAADRMRKRRRSCGRRRTPTCGSS